MERSSLLYLLKFEYHLLHTPMSFADMRYALSLSPWFAQRTATPTVRTTIPCQSISGAGVSCAMRWLTSVSIGLYLLFLGIWAVFFRECGKILSAPSSGRGVQ